MEKTNVDRMVELANEFENVWNSLGKVGKDVALETDELKTPFVVRARMAKRAGSDESEEVLVFLRSDASGKLKECSRCYAADWGFYFNHFGTEGQRIGMYCRALDNSFICCKNSKLTSYNEWSRSS